MVCCVTKCSEQESRGMAVFLTLCCTCVMCDVVLLLHLAPNRLRGPAIGERERGEKAAALQMADCVRPEKRKKQAIMVVVVVVVVVVVLIGSIPRQLSVRGETRWPALAIETADVQRMPGRAIAAERSCS